MRKTNVLNKVLSVFLALAMVLSAMSIPVAAAETGVAQIGETQYGTLQAAIDAAKDGDTVKLIANTTLKDEDIVMAGSYKVMANVDGKNITLDMNEKTITVEYEGGPHLVAVIRVADGAGLTVTGNGAIDVVGENSVNVAYTFWKAGTTGYLTIENGTYHMADTADSMVYTNGHEIVTVKGGTWTLDTVNTRGDSDEPWIFNVQGAGDHSIIITGGTFNADINRQKWSNEAVVAKDHYVIKENGYWTVYEGAVAYVNEGMLTGIFYAPKDVGYATLAEAVAAAVRDHDVDDQGNVIETVTLLKDAEVTGNVDVEDISLVCNEYSVVLASATATLTAPEGLNVTTNVAGGKVVYEEGVYKVQQTLATLTFEGWGGTVEVNYPSNQAETLQGLVDYYLIINSIISSDDTPVITLYGDVTGKINTGTDSYGNTYEGADWTLDLNGHTLNGMVIVDSDSTLTVQDSVGGGKIGGDLVGIDNYGTVTVKDGTIYGELYGIYNNGEAIANVEGGVITSEAVSDGFLGSASIWNESGVVNVTGGKIAAVNADTAIYNEDGTVTVTGGEVYGNGKDAGIVNGEDGTAVLSGGTFDKDYTTGYNNVTIADGYKSVDNGDGTWTVREAHYVAQVGDTKYESLQEALNACTNGETVKLIADITYTGDDVVLAHGGGTGFGKYDAYNPAIIYTGGTKGATDAQNQPSNVNAVLDLNGHTITNNADAYLFMIMDNARLTFKDSVGTGSITSTTENPVIWAVGTDTLVTIESGKYTTASDTGLLWATHGADMVITGGEFSTTADASLLIVRNEKDLNNPNYFCDSNATITVKGGTYYGFNPEKMMDDSTDPYTAFNACADGYIAVDNGDGTWTVKPLITVTFDDITMVVGSNIPEFTYTVEENIDDEYMLVIETPEVTVGGVGTYEITANAYVFMNDNYAVKVIPGTLTVAAAVAEINGVQYASIYDAVNAAQDGDTIKVIADHEVDCSQVTNKSFGGQNTSVLWNITKDITLDLNGKTVTLTNTIPTNGTTLAGIVYVANGADVVVTGNGAIWQNDSDGWADLFFADNGSTLTVKNGTYTCDPDEGVLSNYMLYAAGGLLTIEGGTYTHTTPRYKYIFNVANGKQDIVIKGGTFTKDPAAESEVTIPDGYYSIDNGNGTWTVVPMDAVAMNVQTGKVYDNVTDALDEAKEGQTVKMLNDCEESMVIITKGVTLDLNGKTLTADYLVAFNGNHVVDNGETKGLLKINKNNISLPEKNAQMPVYNGTDGYVFAAIKIVVQTANVADTTELTFKPNFTTNINTMFADGMANNGVNVIVRLTWKKAGGATVSQDFVYSDTTTGTVYSSTQGFTFKATGLNDYTDMTVQIVIASDLGVEIPGELYHVNSESNIQ